MSDVDTSREAVERLAGDVDDYAADCRRNVETHMDLNHPNSAKAFAKMAAHHERTAATLRALLAEREALTARVAELSTSCGHCGNLETAWEERDAARAEVARLRESLEFVEGYAEGLIETGRDTVAGKTLLEEARAALAEPTP